MTLIRLAISLDLRDSQPGRLSIHVSLTTSVGNFNDRQRFRDRSHTGLLYGLPLDLHLPTISIYCNTGRRSSSSVGSSVPYMCPNVNQRPWLSALRGRVSGYLSGLDFESTRAVPLGTHSLSYECESQLSHPLRIYGVVAICHELLCRD